MVVVPSIAGRRAVTPASMTVLGAIRCPDVNVNESTNETKEDGVANTIRKKSVLILFHSSGL